MAISFTKKQTSLASKTIKNISNILLNKTSTRRNLSNIILGYKKRREQEERRQQLQDELGAVLRVSRPGGSRSLSLSQSGGSFVSRIVGFIGYVSSGWLLSNMPTWIAGASELSRRITSLNSTFTSFIDNVGELIGDIGRLPDAFLKNAISFDLTDSNSRVRNSLTDLNDTLQIMGNQITEAFNVLTEPFTNVPPLGTEGGPGAYPGIQPELLSGGQSSSGMSESDFWTLVAVVSREARGSDPQGQADVAQSIYNRAAAGVFPGGSNIRNIILAKRQYQPTRDYPRKNSSGDANPEWLEIKDAESAAKATGFSVATINGVANNIRNPSLQKKAAEYIENRTDFVGKGLTPDKESSTELKRRSPDDNIFGNFVGPESFEYGEKTAGKPSPIIGQLSLQTQQQTRQSQIKRIFNLEIHHPAANERQRSGLIESVSDPANEVTRAFISEFGTYGRGFRDLGGPKRGLNLLELANEKGVEWNAQKIIKVIKQFPDTQFNLFAGHMDVAPGTGGMGAPGEQVFNPAVCIRVQELANSLGLNNVKYYPSQAKVSAGDPRSNWSIAQRLRSEQSAARSTPAQVSSGMIPTAVIDDVNVAAGGIPLVGRSGGGGEYLARREGKIHRGIDIGTVGQKGYYVAFKMPGTVTFAGWNEGGFGNLVIIKSGNLEFFFAHLAKVMVKNGASYNGETIGEIGNTGRSSGIHLHFEVRVVNGKDINPEPYLKYLSIGKRFASISPSPTNNLIPSSSLINLQPSEGNVNIDSDSRTVLDQLLENITTERKGRQIVFINDIKPSSTSKPMIMTSGSSGSMLQISESELVNNFIKNKLLLDLNYL